jgi:tetratricopeptide (TPR) repeat protein
VEAAEAKLREYLRTHPESDRAVVLHALALVRLRQPLDAVQELDQFLKTKPDSLIVLRLYAELLTSVSKDHLKAEEAWKRCTSIAPNDGEIWKALGGFYITQARSKDAIQAFEKAARLLPQSAEVAAGLAYGYGQSGQLGNATRWFQKAYALNAAAAKPSPMAYLLHGQYLLSRNRPAEALPLLTKSLSLDPHSADACVWRGLCYERLNDPVKAEADALAALRESDRRRDAWHLLSRLYKAQNRVEKIREIAGRLQRLDEDDYSRLSRGRSLQEQLGKAERFLREGRANEASKYYEEIVQTLPSYYEAYFALGMCYTRAGRLSEAEAAFKKYLETQPQSVDGLAALGTLLLQQGRHQEAIPFLQRSLKLDPDQQDVRKTLAQAYVAGARTKETIAELEYILSFDPKYDLDVYLMLARSYLQIPDESKAREVLERGGSYFPASADYWRGIARILLEVNPDGTLTEEMIKQLVRKFPGDAASHTLFADWAYAKNDYDSCRRALETASSLSPREETKIRILALSGMMEGNRERPDIAEPLFRDSYAINKKLHFPDQHSAMAYVELLERYERDEEAQRCVSEILSVAPGSGAAHFSRAKFLAKRGEHEKAIEEAELALAVAGTNRDLLRTLHAFMARSYFAVGKKEEAQKHQLWLEKNTVR